MDVLWKLSSGSSTSISDFLCQNAGAMRSFGALLDPHACNLKLLLLQNEEKLTLESCQVLLNLAIVDKKMHEDCLERLGKLKRLDLLQAGVNLLTDSHQIALIITQVKGIS